MKKIETERLILREMTPEDFDRLYAVLADSGITPIPSAMINMLRALSVSTNPSVAAYFFRTKRMPRVPGPQWQETVQPASVS